MPLLSSNDKLDVKQVTLVDIVALCSNCVAYCTEATERTFTNRSRAPRGWEKEYEEIAANRRTEDMRQCVESCEAVPRSCPSMEKLRRPTEASNTSTTSSVVAATSKASRTEDKSSTGGLWRSLFSKPAPTVQPSSAKDPSLLHRDDDDDDVSVQALSRCEHAAARFSKVLFAIAQKPSKVSFDSVDPKTGKRMTGDLDALDKGVVGSSSAPDAIDMDRGSATGRKQMDKQAIHDEILRRWSTSRRERSAMEELGVIQTEQGIQQKKQEIVRQQQQQRSGTNATTEPPEASSSGGTVPRW